MPEPVVISKGEILVFRLLDVADSVDLNRVEQLMREGSSRLQIRPRGEAFVVKNAPVVIPIGDDEFDLGGARWRAETQARVWDYGVLSVRFRFAIPSGTTWTQLMAVAADVEASRAFSDVARRRSQSLMQQIGPAARGVHEWAQIEDYTIFFFEQIPGIAQATDLVDRADVPALILAEPKEQLAQPQRRAILDAAVQYGIGDIAVIDWNAAVVLEPSGVRDVPDVIEFALTHLVEFRYYDELLDDRLNTLYEAVGQRRTRLIRGDYATLSHEASALFMELSQFIERVDNSLKFSGDFYLATIFRTAVQQFSLAEWEQNVLRRIELVGRVAELLNGEANARRSHILEVIVVLLILFEIVWAILGFH